MASPGSLLALAALLVLACALCSVCSAAPRYDDDSKSAVDRDGEEEALEYRHAAGHFKGHSTNAPHNCWVLHSTRRYPMLSSTFITNKVQVWRDLAGQLLLQRSSGDSGPIPICHHKRNSEIINSLLGIPKTMTDAGRK